ncbi:hypothetical protein KFL_000180460 [Klebsormidium nitens]|uniref:Iron export ABC transporter permease subunit FetB n=1 Tax=Klebsormidium nitens TaxID=105231 RepID=A0A1Y1HLB7_KLENI|nr:hypothetical protein KFL_000180460 [Klebsormidium nitens]|eukprot:GAQ78763.1 hypothetical protein KFL_000180460 [Klebsormidium nitens]
MANHLPAFAGGNPYLFPPSPAPSVAEALSTVVTDAQDDFVRGLLRPVAAMALVFVAMLISWREGVGLEKEMLVAVVRSFVQLIGIGFALQFVFAQKGFALILLSISIMILIAGYTAGQRAKAVPGSHHVATLAILVGTSITTTALVLLRVFPFEPRYIIPIAGMITGNAMTVTGVTMKRLREDIRLQHLEVEAALALGATPRQASLVQLRRSLGTGMSPVIDNAKTIGLVSLPGAMTGLIMGGASPLEAVQLQIVVMYMLIGAATFSGLTATYLSQPKFFTPAYQLKQSAISNAPAVAKK